MVLCRACVRCQAAHKRCDTLPGHIVCQRCLGRKGKPVQCVWKPSRQGQRNDLLSHGRETFVKARFEQSPASNDALPSSANKIHSAASIETTPTLCDDSASDEEEDVIHPHGTLINDNLFIKPADTRIIDSYSSGQRMVFEVQPNSDVLTMIGISFRVQPGEFNSRRVGWIECTQNLPSKMSRGCSNVIIAYSTNRGHSWHLGFVGKMSAITAPRGNSTPHGQIKLYKWNGCTKTSNDGSTYPALYDAKTTSRTVRRKDNHGMHASCGGEVLLLSERRCLSSLLLESVQWCVSC